MSAYSGHKRRRTDHLGFTPDFCTLFESAPGAYLVLAPDPPKFTIVAVTDAYLQTTMTERKNIIGLGLFEVFPDNPADPSADGTSNLRASLDRVLKNKKPELMPVQKYDIRRPVSEGGKFEERFWTPTNAPVLDENGVVEYIVHRVEDVTEVVREREAKSKQAETIDALHRHTKELEFEIALRAREPKGPTTGGRQGRSGFPLNRQTASFLFLALLIVLNSVAFYRGLRRIVNADNWVKHTLEVETQIQAAATSIQRARAGQRTYLVNHEPSFWEEYRQALEELTLHVGQLQTLTSDNPRQQATLRTLEPLLRARAETFDAVIQSGQSKGLTAAAQTMMSQHSVQQDQEISWLLQGMHDEEARLLALRRDEAQAGFRTALATLIVSVVSGLALFAITFRLLAKSLGEREGAAALLEKRVEIRTAELRQANAELEAFSYTVSHDLRAPLRAMWGYSHALSEDYGVQLDATANDYLREITDAAKRMDKLISDLLTYSRISRTDVPLEPVDVNKCCSEALSRIRDESSLGGEWLRVQPDIPIVLGNEVLLTQVLANLLSNAVKFVAEGESADVRVISQSHDGRVSISILDKGIGIASEHQDRIFRVFERLHGVETYSGTGIGLAIVKRSVEKMKGRIGVESSPGHGSRFWIELPLAQEKQQRAA